jgi:hypothetical protein
LFLEVDHGPCLVDHNLFLSPKALLLVSQGGAYAHNLIAGGLDLVPFELPGGGQQTLLVWPVMAPLMR